MITGDAVKLNNGTIGILESISKEWMGDAFQTRCRVVVKTKNSVEFILCDPSDFKVLNFDKHHLEKTLQVWNELRKTAGLPSLSKRVAFGIE